MGKNNLIYYKKLVRLIDFKSRSINDELVKKHFLVQNVKNLLEKLQKLKSKPTSSKKKTQVDLINSVLQDLKKEIKDMSEQEKEIENADEIINLVENILEFNKQQKGLGLKILTPNQMLSKLPTSLAQLKAGNN